MIIRFFSYGLKALMIAVLAAAPCYAASQGENSKIARSGQKKDSRTVVKLINSGADANDFGGLSGDAFDKVFNDCKNPGVRVAAAPIIAAAGTIVIQEILRGISRRKAAKQARFRANYTGAVNVPDLSTTTCFAVQRRTTLEADGQPELASQIIFKIEPFGGGAATIRPVHLWLAYAAAETGVNKNAESVIKEKPVDFVFSVGLSAIQNAGKANARVQQLTLQSFSFDDIEFEKQYSRSSSGKYKIPDDSISTIFVEPPSGAAGAIAVTVTETGSEFEKLGRQAEFFERHRSTIATALGTIYTNLTTSE